MPKRVPVWLVYCQGEIAYLRRYNRRKKAYGKVLSWTEAPDGAIFLPGASLEIGADDMTEEEVYEWLRAQLVEYD